MPRKSKSRKKKGAGMFDFLKTGESKSYTKKRLKFHNSIIVLILILIYYIFNLIYFYFFHK